MAISPYATAAQQDFIPLRDYTPVAMIGNTLDKLDARQAEGVAAADKLGILRDELSAQVLPGQQQFADDYLSSVDEEIGALSESGDYIDAMPKIRNITRRVAKDMRLLNQNYSQVQERRQQMEELMAKGEVLTPADQHAFLTAPVEALSQDPEARFNAPMLTPRIDRDKLLNDFFKDMDPTTKVSFRTVDGKWQERRELSTLTADEIMQAGRYLLQNNPSIQAETRRDLGFAESDPEAFQASANEFVAGQLQDLDAARHNITTNADLTDEQKASALAKIDERLTSLSQKGDDEYRAFLADQAISRSILPYAQRGQTFDEDITRTADPFLLENARQRNRVALQSQRDAAAATRSVSASRSAANTLRGISSAVTQRNPIPRGTNFQTVLDTGVQTIEALQQQLAQTQDPFQQQGIQRQIDHVTMETGLVADLREQALAASGISPEQLAVIEAQKPQPPAGITPAELDELNERAMKEPTSGGGLVGLGKYGTKPLSADQSEYAREYRRWKTGLTDEQQAQNEAVEDYVKEWQDNLTMVAAPTLGLTGEKKTLFTSIMNGPDNIGKVVYEGTVEDGEKLTDEVPHIENFTQISEYPMPSPDGSMHYRAYGYTLDKGEKTNYEVILTNDDEARNWIGGLTGDVVNTTGWGYRLHGLASGLGLSPQIAGQNPLGEGGKVVKDPNGKTFTMKYADGRTQAGLTLPQITAAMEALEQRAYAQ